jgi:hypothetical protein
LKTKWIVSKLVGLIIVSVGMVHAAELDWVRECVAGHIKGEPAPPADLCRWPAVRRSICYAGESLTYRELPNNSFLLSYCMVSIIPVFSLQCRIRVYCLVCAMHTLKSDYWFLCIVCVLHVLLLLVYPIVLHMNCFKCYIWVFVYSRNVCWSQIFFSELSSYTFVDRRAIFKLDC